MIYVLRSDGAYVSFEGMTEAEVTAMLADQGMDCTFVDESTFRSVQGASR